MKANEIKNRKNNMRYRIKITTFKNGRKQYVPQVKVLIGWMQVGFDGDQSYAFDAEYDTREKALEKIDRHYNGNAKTQKIEFEYIEL